jgi:hypothetical protein
MYQTQVCCATYSGQTPRRMHKVGVKTKGEFHTYLVLKW